LWLVVPIVIAVTATGIYSFSQPKTYTAKASSYFSIEFGQTASDLFQGANYTQLQLASFASLAEQPIVLDAVIQQLNLPITTADLASRVSVVASTDTVIVDIFAEAESPEAAAEIANAINAELGKVVARLSPQNIKGNPTVQAVVVSRATPPLEPSGPENRKNLGIGLLAGLLLGLLAAISSEKLDTRVLGENDLPTGLPVLGTIVSDKDASQPSAWHSSEGGVLLPQAFSRIQANLRFASVDKPITRLLVTSAVPGEGKSTVAVGLALSFAESGARTILVDADMRRPRVEQYLDLEGAVGLSDVLVGSVTWQEVVQEWGGEGLRVLPAGSKPPNSTLMLQSRAMADFLDELAKSFDVLILDSPPLLAVVDPLALVTNMDGMMLVVGRGKVRTHQLRAALQATAAAKANLVGVVMNRMPVPRKRIEKYGY
jgi:capsular exopolysaccharide synthesis family protein